MTLGRAIKVARTRAARKQREIAHAVGCTPVYVSMIETGHKNPGAGLLGRIAAELRTTVEKLNAEALEIAKAEAEATKATRRKRTRAAGGAR